MFGKTNLEFATAESSWSTKKLASQGFDDKSHQRESCLLDTSVASRGFVGPVVTMATKEKWLGSSR